MTPAYSISPEFDRELYRWRNWFLIAGAVLFIASIAGAFFNPPQFYRSYLMGYLFWIGLTLGAMALVMVQYLTGGAWGVVSRRPLESAMRTLPLVAILFIPILVGMTHLYAWANVGIAAADETLRHRHGYMNVPWFIVRTVIYFAIWMLLSAALTKWSDDEDAHGSRLRRLAAISAPGLILYVFTMTFASVDWAESLVTNWASTIWGFYFVVGQGLSAMGFVIVVLTLLAHRPPLASVVTVRHFHDLGKLLFMFVMLWGYMAFSQLLIVWTGNLTDEIPWYVPGYRSSWRWIGIALIALQFLLPFLLLLSRDVKRNPKVLCGVVAILIGMRFVDLFWIVMPRFHPTAFQLNWLNFSVPLAIGGLWIGAYLRELQKRPLLPLQAPELEGALAHGRH